MIHGKHISIDVIANNKHHPLQGRLLVKAEYIASVVTLSPGFSSSGIQAWIGFTNACVHGREVRCEIDLSTKHYS